MYFLTVYLVTLSVASDGRLIDEWWMGKDLEETARGLVHVLSLNSPRGIKENHKNVTITRVRVEIWTEHPPNTSLEHYWYTSISGDTL
jgi:hypothetical protein